MDQSNIYLVDGVSAVAVHNGVGRVQFIQIGVDGAATESLQLLIPLNAVKTILDALRKLPGA